MSDRAAGRFFGNERVEWFDGGLFDGAEVIPCTRDELDAMHEAALLDWSRVEPAILGTLFERGLDPDKRGQLGAHYTDHAKIMLVVEPVVLDPLRREFAAMRERVEELAAGREPSPLTLEGRRRERLPPWERDAEAEWRAFLERLRAVRVLDPACGSGNFCRMLACYGDVCGSLVTACCGALSLGARVTRGFGEHFKRVGENPNDVRAGALPGSAPRPARPNAHRRGNRPGACVRL